MIQDMPHPRPPYLQREVTRYDKTIWYVRRERHGPRIRLKAVSGRTVWIGTPAGQGGCREFGLAG